MMTPQQLHILQHSLGLDRYGRGNAYRNHFCTGKGSTDHPDCMALVELGFMIRHADKPLHGGDDLFTVTVLGRAAVAAHSPAPPRLSPGQQRYRDWLAADSTMTFMEWLRWRTSSSKGSTAQ